MLNVDEQVKHVEGIYRQITGADPKRSETPIAPIPPDANPEQYVQQKLDQLQATMQGTTAAPSGALTVVIPRVAVFDGERDWRCAVELPGVKKSDMVINAVQGVLRISATRALIGGERAVYSELFPCRFERALPLPPTTKEEGIEARLENGILTVRCQKEPVAFRKDVKIEVV
jgi:HSP20 family molecular chaperone IbpA